VYGTGPGLQCRQIAAELTAAMPGSVRTEFFVPSALVSRIGSSATVNLRVVSPRTRRFEYKSAMFSILFEIVLIPPCSAVPSVCFTSPCGALLLRLLRVVSAVGSDHVFKHHKG